MDEDAQFSAPKRRRWRIAACAAAAVACFGGGFIATGGATPASGDPTPTEWTPLTLKSGWDNTSPYADTYDFQYKVDDEGQVHVRGSALTGGIEVARGQGGPWTAPIFDMPCGVWPDHIVGGLGGLNDANGLESYDGGLRVNADGTVEMIVWDAPVLEDAGVNKVSLVVTVDFEYDADADDDCEEPTTTTAPPEETTTTEAEG
jgi:hypothetical protein